MTRHIEYLLLEHDHIAVPGLGTFVSRTEPLRIDDGGMFYVPRRDVSFMATAHDDGMLVSWVSSQEGCSADESRALIARWVEEMQLEVGGCGCYDMGSLGQMVMHDGVMVFEPCKAGLQLQAYYGLDNFEMPVLPLLATQIKEAVERAEEQQEQEAPSSRHIVIRLNRTVVNYVASIAAGIVLFLAFTTPTAHTATGHASVAPGFFVPMQPVEEDVAGEAHAVAINNTVQDEAVAPAAAGQPVQEEEARATAQGYAVVVASSIKMVNAEAMVARLKGRGIEGAQVFVHGNMTRVAFLGYDTREAAVEAAARLRRQDKELEGAWVFEIK